MKFLMILLSAFLFAVPVKAQDSTNNCRIELIKTEEPVYPDSAKKYGIEGIVLIRISIDPDGTVGTAYVTESSDNEFLDASAMKAVLKYKFKSIPKDCVLKTNIKIRFKLNK